MAARELLLADNAATGNTVGSVDSYVANRIQREDPNVKADFPYLSQSPWLALFSIKPAQGWVRLPEPNTMSKETQHTDVELCSGKITRWVLFFYSGHIWPA